MELTVQFCFCNFVAMFFTDFCLHLNEPGLGTFMIDFFGFLSNSVSDIKFRYLPFSVFKLENINFGSGKYQYLKVYFTYLFLIILKKSSINVIHII